MLNGKGTFPAQQNENPKIATSVSQVTTKEHLNKTIERIVIFYKDGSFKSFEE